MKVLFRPAAKRLTELDARAVGEADVVVIDGDRVAKDREGRAPRRAGRSELAWLRAAAARKSPR